MNLAWMIQAEGIGQDARGALTAIGLSQDIIVAAMLPHEVRRAVIAHLVVPPGEERLAPGESFGFTFSVLSPSDKAIAVQSGKLQVGETAFPDLPAGADLPVQFALTLPEYGRYRITLSAKLPSKEVAGEVEFYVREVPEGFIPQ